MIHEKTQETPYNLEYINQNPTPKIKSHIAFIGDYTACSLLAGRAIKTHKIDYDSSISSEFNLPHYNSMYSCYYVKENQMIFDDNTITYVIVHQDHVRILEIRRELVKLLNVDINNEPIIQISKVEGANGLSEEQRILANTDWEVIKQLEILLLSDTELGKARAKLREMLNSKQ